MLKGYLKRFARGAGLSAEESAEALGWILDGACPDVQASAYLTASRLRGFTPEEVAGAVHALWRRTLALPKALPDDVIDIAGTGGDAPPTFNISTLAGIVAAACGARVAKSARPRMASRCGAAELFDAIGVASTTHSPTDLAETLAAPGFAVAREAVWQAPLTRLRPLLRELGLRTILDLAAPLASPARPTRLLVGIAPAEWQPIAGAALRELGITRAWVVTGDDGTDEISIGSTTRVMELDGPNVRTLSIRPADVDLPTCDHDALRGGTPEEMATLGRELLRGERSGPTAYAVAVNAGAALCLAGVTTDWREGTERALACLTSGAAARLLDGFG